MTVKSILNEIRIPGEEQLLSVLPGSSVSLTGISPSLAAAEACALAEKGKRVLLVMDNDLKASRAAEDVRQLLDDRCAFIPAGEIDLTRAAGSQESSWRIENGKAGTLQSAYHDPESRGRDISEGACVKAGTHGI